MAARTRPAPSPVGAALGALLLLLTAGCTDRAAAAPGPPPPAPPARRAPPASRPAAPASQPRAAVHIVPIGDVPAETVLAAARGLREHVPVEPVVHPARPLPAQARIGRTARYRAEVLLAWLEGLPLPRGGRILGITEVDIATRKGRHESWGILGLGSLGGPGCVLSTYRMRRRWERGGAPPALVRARLWKTSVHELGHTLGLDHCPVRGCLMEDGQGTVKTTDRASALCPACAARYAARLEALAARR